jgi:hypothetical protein
MLRTLGTVLAILLVLVAGARLALGPLATRQTRAALASIPGYRGSFGRVTVGVLPPRYAVTDVRLDAESGRTRFAAARVGAIMDGRALLHGRVVARVDVDGARLDVTKRAQAAGPRGEKTELDRPPDLSGALARLPPFLVQSVQIRSGEVVVRDADEPSRPGVRLRAIEATLDNVATRRAMEKERPAVFALSATLQQTGRLSVYASADPLMKEPTFAGQASLLGMRLAELGGLVGAKTDVKPDKGVLDLFARFQAERGAVTGGLKVVVKEPGVKPAAPGLLAKVKTLLADIGLKIFSDRVPGREGIATTVPIQGRIEDPKAQLWPTLFGVLRNAFVQGLDEGFGGVPPRKAKREQSVPEQARRALTSNRKPLAQPKEGR